MPYTQTQYDTLCDAIGQGALIVEYGDKKVTYRSLDDMIRIKVMMEKDLGLNSNTSRKIVTSFNKGLNTRVQTDSRWADGNDWDHN